MKPHAYYNEIDPNAAAWLRELIARKLITDGDVDERSIVDVQPGDLDGYARCHFFAGIGIWDLALNLAKWGDRPVWTASLPCQPFSDSGEGRGAEDDRNLWSVFHRLVEVQRPQRVYGEQVAAAIGFDWLDRVQTDMEALGYLTGQAVLGAFSVGAPHIRRRLYWMADAENSDRRSELESRSKGSGRDGLAGGGEPAFRLGNPVGPRLQGHAGDVRDGDQPGRINPDEARPVAEAGATLRGVGDATGGGFGELGDAARARSGGHADGTGELGGLGDSNRDGCEPGHESTEGPRHGNSVEPASGWDGKLILCRDGKHRRIPVEPDFFPLVDAGKYVVPGLARRRTVRPALLKGPGNAIVAEVAKVFIEVSEEAINEL